MGVSEEPQDVEEIIDQEPAKTEPLAPFTLESILYLLANLYLFDSWDAKF